MNTNDIEIVVIHCRYYALIFDNTWVNIKEPSTLQASGLTNSNDIEIVVVIIIRYYFFYINI